MTTTEQPAISLVMSTSGGGDFGPFCATLTLGRADVERLLRAADVFRAAKALSPDLYQTTYFDYSPDFLESDSSLAGDVPPEDQAKITALFAEDDGDLLCAECGNPLIILAGSVTHHLIPESHGTDDWDHDMDDDHVALIPEDDEPRIPEDGYREAKPWEVPEQGNVRLDYCKLIIADAMSTLRPGMVDIHWKACIKHTDVEIATCEIEEEAVRELLGRLPPG